MVTLSPITAMLTADIVQFREAMVSASDLTNKWSMDVSAASVRANAAFRSAETAAEQLATAQKGLADLQAKGGASADELAAAEERVELAERKLATAGEAASLAQERLMVAQQRLAKESAAAAEATKASSAATEKSGGVLAAVGGPLKIAAALTAAVGFESVKTAAKFDSSMELLHTQANVPQAEVDNLKGKVLGLAGAVAQDPDSLAEALFHIESNFESMPGSLVKSGGALNVLRIAAEGATVGHADLVDTTNALTAAMASNIPGVSNAAQTMGVLNAIVGVGDMKMQDLAKAFSTGAVANVSLYGATIQDVGAGLAVLGDNNTRATRAGTLLRMAVQDLIHPIKGAGDELKRLGLTQQQLATTMEQHGMIGTLKLLHEHLDKAGVKTNQYGDVLTTIFGKRAGAAVAEFVGQFDRVMSKYPAMNAGAKSFGDAWDATQKQFSTQMSQIGEGLKAVGIRIGEWLIPKIEAGIEWVRKIGTEFINWFEHSKTVQSAIKIVSDAWENQFMPPIKAGWSFLTSNLMPIFHQISAWFQSHPKEVGLAKEALLLIFKAMVDISAFLTGQFIGGLIRVGTFFGGQLVMDVKAGIAVFNAVKDAIGWVIDKLNSLGSALNVVSAMSGVVSSAKSLLSFDQGGFVPGSKGQPHLAIVHGGEFVVSNDMMSSGKLPGNAALQGGAGPSGGGMGGGVVVENHFYVDGQQIQPVMQRQSLRYNRRNSTNGLALVQG